MSTTNSPTARPNTFLGFIDLNEGVGFGNMVTFYFACFTGIMLAAFTPQLQPYILDEFLKIPSSEQGMITGNLAFYGEITIILTTGIWGTLSDKIGRRPLMAGSYLIVALSMYLYPRVTSYDELIVARIIFNAGIGAYSCIIITLMADYARDNSRGKASGLLGMGNGLGAMLSVFILLQLPAFFQGQGMDPIEAGYATYNTAAIIAIVTAVIMWFGLKKIEVVQVAGSKSESMLSLAKQGLTAGKDPGVALAYGASFIARGNVALVGAFFTLWLKDYGIEEKAMSSADALAKAGMILGIAQSIALLSAPVFGILTDRINRTTALIITLVCSVIGYCGTYFVSDPFSAGMLVCAAFIGMAEVGCIITSAVLISQQTPVKIRGSVMGFFNLSGGVGILISAVVGGWLFDNWLGQGPFVFMGAMALVVLVWAILVKDKIVPLNENAQLSAGH
ncbi:MFS transporter [Oceanicoccus sp. KOV_DT_Chl]|uniref:MFS transporter n=1 Tax=Oceanicoccus sp. KOV_DT_Chl TaxID=1904639 RepID=UPI001F437F86|nr:MFS transporter [Oceanicoccus sp. KOV_DT_Chl]